MLTILQCQNVHVSLLHIHLRDQQPTDELHMVLFYDSIHVRSLESPTGNISVARIEEWPLFIVTFHRYCIRTMMTTRRPISLSILDQLSKRSQFLSNDPALLQPDVVYFALATVRPSDAIVTDVYFNQFQYLYIHCIQNACTSSEDEV